MQQVCQIPKTLGLHNKTPTRISLLSLLINSKGHHNLLLKILNEADKFGGVVNNLTVGSHLSSSEEVVPTKGRGHNQPLHIFVKCGDYMIARVLIDNGSSLNVLPKTTLDKLCSTNPQLRASLVIVDESEFIHLLDT
ncbi:hypothetical protein CR513_17739, partial [Mucuna pruriens]